MCVAAIIGVAKKAVAYPTPEFDPADAYTESSNAQVVTRIVYWTVEVMQSLTLGFIKLSAMFFYKRIFRTGNSKFIDIATWTIIAVVIVWTISFFWALVFECGTHFDYLWVNLEDLAKCSNTVELLKGFAISDVITDFIILLFPMPLIWRLQLRTQQKVALSGIFFLGALAIAASITRMVIFLQALSAEFASTTDQDLLSTAGVYCMIIEVGFGLCAICLPSLSGILKVKAIQNLITGFTSIFSSRFSHSHSSIATHPTAKQHRLGSFSDSERAGFASEGGTASCHSFEMRRVQNQVDGGIRVTTDVDLSAEAV
ncbi:hypothetical protein MMC11_007966 [Xylographa trunciseda]|nr:hypothetical protein [Xylographa trunciseda]